MAVNGDVKVREGNLAVWIAARGCRAQGGIFLRVDGDSSVTVELTREQADGLIELLSQAVASI